MRIVYFANNWLGWQIGKWLKSHKEEIVALVIHPKHQQKYADELISELHLPAERIIDAPTLRTSEGIAKIKEINPDMGLSIMFGFILKPDMINLFPKGIINLHPSYLPFNRGAYPNVWSIVEETPAGVSLHYIDSGIDTGGLIAQKQISVEPIDTGKSLYKKLEEESLKLFKEQWPLIKSGRHLSIPKNIDEIGSYHRKKDIVDIDKIDLDKEYEARTLINILRARTFPPYNGAYFVENGRKVYLRLELYYEEDIE